MRRPVTLLILIILSLPSFSQVSGTVLDLDGQPLVGANVWWLGTSTGTVTDVNGQFSLARQRGRSSLVASYVGYVSDTMHVHDTEQPVTIVLVANTMLGEVDITERRTAVLRSRTAAFDVETLNSDELCKAACCNLSEAFETNASVDVAFSDAATGAKTIRLLGLSGTYVQLLNENTPGIRGLAQQFGMEYIPGPWMNSIQVSKGTSSVINGYEATTGQINIELLKPQTQDPVSVNLMLNSELHAEINAEGGWQIPLKAGQTESEDKLYTGVMLHYQNGMMPMDENKDGFIDMPLSHNLNIVNRWFYRHDDYTLQAFVRGLYDRRDGGQQGLAKSGTTETSGSSLTAAPYLIALRTHRIDGFLKNGIVFDDETSTSLGIIAAASYHDQHNSYGNRLWDASQTNAYLNAIFQTAMEGPAKHGIDNDHRISAGLSANYDKYQETLLLPLPQSTSAMPAVYPATPAQYNFSRQEVTPGIFAEYALKIDDILSLVAGVRADWSSRYGFFFTPRMNVRYSPWQWWTIRASAGLGYRSPNIIADNAFFLPSSRTLTTAAGYEPEQEKAVNTGVSTTFHIPIASRELSVSAEYYFTNFFNGVIADLDKDKHGVSLYNISDISGRSFAHNAQLEASMEVLRGWTITAAFRYTDTRQTAFNGTTYSLRLKPLTNRWKGIITTSYQTPLKKWQFDLTAQFNGGGRMPDGFNDYLLTTIGSNQYYTATDGSLYYRWYPQLMAQVTKYFRTCSVYLGAENMTNFRQDSPVLHADAPFSEDFDASMAWGPVTGWKIYLGFRWSLPKPE
ncbi:MAG: TonB-dependent receptor [Paludibacteraceae bacterium]|nr:TonB-dependent receptor [Paludibacteraceae bacterium]